MDEILAWLREWQARINAGDFEAAKPLFSDNVIAYGSLTPVMAGKDDLIGRQWSSVWPRIKDFSFNFESLHTFADERMSVVAAATLWQSLGLRSDGSWYQRRGRATLVFKREGARYLCIHSHFSMEPGIPPVDS